MNQIYHYSDVIKSVMASQTTGISFVCSNVCSGADQRKRQSSASLAFVRGIHRWLVNYPHKGPVTWKMFPFDDVIMCYLYQPNEPLSSSGISLVVKSSKGPISRFRHQRLRANYRHMDRQHHTIIWLIKRRAYQNDCPHNISYPYIERCAC